MRTQNPRSSHYIIVQFHLVDARWRARALDETRNGVHRRLVENAIQVQCDDIGALPRGEANAMLQRSGGCRRRGKSDRERPVVNKKMHTHTPH